MRDDDRVSIKLIPDRRPGDGGHTMWLAALDADRMDGRREQHLFDATGPTPELALTSLLHEVSSAYLDLKESYL